MPADLGDKTGRYEELLAAALDDASAAAPADTPAGDAAAACLSMAESYLADGRHFRAEGDPVNALAAFSYGHGWLDAGARLGVLSVPPETDRFTV